MSGDSPPGNRRFASATERFPRSPARDAGDSATSGRTAHRANATKAPSLNPARDSCGRRPVLWRLRPDRLAARMTAGPCRLDRRATVADPSPAAATTTSASSGALAGGRGAVRARRPGRVLGERRRDAAPRRRQADPGREQVRALPRAARAGPARGPGFRGVLDATRCPRRCGWPSTGFERLSSAYPTADRAAIAQLGRLTAEQPGRRSLMVDSSAQLDLIESAAAAAPEPVRVAIELDVGYWAAGGRLKIGPKRSPIRTPEQAVALAREIERRPGVRLVGLMAYEGHDRRARRPAAGQARCRAR